MSSHYNMVIIFGSLVVVLCADTGGAGIAPLMITVCTWVREAQSGAASFLYIEEQERFLISFGVSFDGFAIIL